MYKIKKPCIENIDYDSNFISRKRQRNIITQKGRFLFSSFYKKKINIGTYNGKGFLELTFNLNNENGGYVYGRSEFIELTPKTLSRLIEELSILLHKEEERK